MRRHPIQKEWLLRFHKLVYELIGVILYLGGLRRAERWVIYPVARLFGRLFGRERAAEQYVAETEYVYETVMATDRNGIGSAYWLTGVTTLIGGFLLGYGIGWTFVLIVSNEFAPTSPGVLTGIGGLTTLVTGYVALSHLPSVENEG